MRFVNEVCAEGTQANLDEGAVEEDLGVDGEVGDGFLEMGHEEHVACFVVFVVEGEVVDLAEVGSGTDNVGAVLEEVRAQGCNEVIDLRIVCTGSDLGVEVLW